MKFIYNFLYNIIMLLDLLLIYFTFNIWIESEILSVIITSILGTLFVYIYFTWHFEKKKMVKNINNMIFIMYSISFMVKTYAMKRGSDEYMMLMYPIYMIIGAGILLEICPKEK